jgi:hypothetical protein
MFMIRSLKFVNVAILSALIGSAAAIYAQEEKPQEEKPAHQEEAKPAPKANEARPANPNEAEPAQDRPMENMGKQEEKPAPRPEQSHEQAMPTQQSHPAQAQAQPAGKGGHIPDDKFHASFGRTHTFTAKTVIVEGRPQFQYGGYSFQLVDAWPVGWAYTDDCYIDYIDGEYFLFDLLHPGIRVAIFVVM